METRVTRTQVLTGRTVTTAGAEYILSVEQVDGRLTQLTAEVFRVMDEEAPDGTPTRVSVPVGTAAWKDGRLSLTGFPLDGATAGYVAALNEIVEQIEAEG